MDNKPTRESLWEFNAPRFVDFSAPLADDDNADAWFDAMEAATAAPLVGQEIVQDPSLDDTPQRELRSKVKSENISPKAVIEQESGQVEVLGKMAPTNICKSLEEWNKGKGSKNKAAELRQSPRIKKNVALSTPQQTSRKRRSEAPSVNSEAKAAKSRRSVPVPSTPSADGSLNQKKAAKIPKLTMPSTPSFMKRHSSKVAKGKTTEEIEMEKVNKIKQQLAQNRKKNEVVYKKAMSACSYIPARSTTHLTKPQEFQFATDSRVKTHDMTTRQDESQDFVHQLRHHKSPAKSHKGPTVAQPFHFSDSNKRKSADVPRDAGKYKSMAELVSGFSNKTPDRFRTRSRSKGVSPAVKAQGGSPKLTVPKTPQFCAPTRKRPSTAIGHTQKEEQEIEEIKKYKFKANPVDERIFTNPNMGVKKVASKGLTEPQGFQFETSKRVKKDVSKSSDESHSIKEEHKIIKAKPIPHGGIPFQPKLNHQCTVPQPFGFDERDKKMTAHKEEKINKIYQEEKKASEFHAQPLPGTPTPLPPKQAKSPTIPETPNLHVKQRGALKAEKWSKQMEEELKQKRAQANFHARPCKVAYEQPFVPQKSHKPLTDVNEFKLNTERRSHQRDEFETYKKQKELDLELAAKARQEQIEAEEKAAISKLRHDLIHKPNVIKNYKPVEVLPSQKPLTEPKTPAFSERINKKYRV